MKSLLRDSGIALIPAVIILAISAVINRWLDYFDLPVVAIAAGSVVLTLIISGFTTMIIVRGLNSAFERLGDRFDSLGDRFDSVAKASSAEWLYSELRLQEIERHVKCGEVWIITASLAEEESEHQYFPIIKANLERGLKYIYLIPKDEILNEKKRAIERKLGAKLASNVRFQVVDDPLFRIIGMQDMAVYVPCEGDGSNESPSAYMNLPISVDGTAQYIKLGSTQTLTLIAHLREHAQKT